MNCTNCHHDNRTGRRFCAECGQPLVLPCPACAAANEPGEKFCGECGTALTSSPKATPSNERGGDTRGRSDTANESGARKVVTIIFADLVGSTALHERLDAESAQRLMDRYYEVLRAVVEDGGGAVVKLLGDGVMAAFGLRQVCEDDALRAVRAAVAMQQAFAALAAERSEVLGQSGLRVAVHSGEVVVSGDHNDVVGDPVNVAARLQDQGGSGEVVIGESTKRLVATQVTLAPLGSVTLKGRTEAVAAYRLVSLEPPAKAAVAPFVGREAEMRRLSMAYQVAVGTPASKLAVLLGSPGLGKSRLVGEFIRRHGEEATVLAAHCDVAGGATFDPLVRAFRGLLGLGDAAAGDAVRHAIEAAMSSDNEATETARIVRGVTAFLEGSPASPEETFFVVRRFLVALTTSNPVVVVIDDLQWAEPLLLDLVEHLVQWGGGVPLFVLGSARPELRDVRSSLLQPGGLVSDVVTLGGLDAGAATRLAANVIGAADLPAAVAAKVLATSEGNPLFVSELVRMLVQEGALTQVDDRWVEGEGLASLEMPPTIHALLAARIERLRPEERFVLERAAVVGRHFSRGAIAALLGSDGEALDARLEVLTRGELIERDTGWFLGEPALRFHHLLIRDAAYRRLLKGTRAELHARLADWIEGRAGEATDQDETIGRHLEQAYLLLRELGPLDAAGRTLGERGSLRLAAAGRRALARDDVALAAGLLGRALNCLPATDPARAELALDWCESLLAAGEVAPAVEAIEELTPFAADSARLRAWQICFESQRSVLTEPQNLQATAENVAAAAATLEKLEDAAGEAKAHSVHAAALVRLGKMGDCEAALDRALAAARRAGDRRRANAVLAGAPVAALWGPSPVTRASGRCLDVVRVLRITQGAPAVEAVALSCQGVLEALRGRIDAARRMVGSARKMVEELGIAQRLFETDVFAARIDLLENDAPSAEKLLRSAFVGFRQLGLGIDAARAGALLARARLIQGDATEAETLSHESEMLAGDDLQAAIAWRGVRAEALAMRGEHAQAIELARAAVAIAETTDALLDHADARLSLAAALRAGGRIAEADAEQRRAVELWEAKGASMLVGRTGGEDLAVPAAGGESAAPFSTPQASRVRPNALTALLARADAAIGARDMAAVAALSSADYTETDHRLGVTYGYDEMLETTRRFARLDDAEFHQQPIATLGESLAVVRRRWGGSSRGGHRFDVGVFENEAVSVLEADGRGLLCRQEVFSPDHLSKALSCLYRWHSESLPEGPARDRAAATSRAVGALIGAFEAERVAAACSPDVEVHDHRRVGFGVLKGPEAVGAAVQALVDLSETIEVHIHDVLALTDDVLVMLGASTGTTNSSGNFERPACELWFFAADGRIARWERFDAEDSDKALARLDEATSGVRSEHHAEVGTPAQASAQSRNGTATREASSPEAIVPNAAGTQDPGRTPSRFDNDATRAGRLLRDRWLSRDWPGFLRLLTDGFLFRDRQSTSHLELARDEYLQFVREIGNFGSRELRTELVGTRGERLALNKLQLLVADGDVGPSEMKYLNLIEVDDHGRLLAMVRFAADDIEAAWAELDNRYKSGEAAQHPLLFSCEDELLGGVNRRAWEQFPDFYAKDFVANDERPAGFGTLHGGAPHQNAIRAMIELAPDARLRLLHIRTVGRISMVEAMWHGTRDGGAFESPFLSMFEADAAGKMLRQDIYDPAHSDRAWARFEESCAAAVGSSSAAHSVEGTKTDRADGLVKGPASANRSGNDARQAIQIPINEAWRAHDRWLACCGAGDWESARSLLSPDVVMKDGRRLIRLEGGADMAIENARQTVGLGAWPERTLLATAGERLMLEHLIYRSRKNPDSFQIELLVLYEIDDSNRIVVANAFDADDEIAARDELGERYAAAGSDGMPAVFREFSRAVNAHDLAALKATLSGDYILDDHRRTGMGRIEGVDAHVAALEAVFQLTTDWRVDLLYYLNVGPQGGVSVTRTSGFNHEGGAFESYYCTVTLVRDGKIAIFELFELEDRDKALARFAGLAPSDAQSIEDETAET